MPTLAPKPPPTSGATTRMAPGSSPSRPAEHEPGDLRVLSAHPDGQLAVGPLGGSGAPSIGTGASRWFTMVRSTTTSQLSKAAGSAGTPPVTATFDSAAGEQQRLAGQRRVDAHHRGQRLVVDADQFGRVLALVAVIGEHDRHRLADVAHPVNGEQRLRPRAAERQRAASLPPLPSSGGGGGRSVRSAAVSTAITPGACRAVRSVSRRRSGRGNSSYRLRYRQNAGPPGRTRERRRITGAARPAGG